MVVTGETVKSRAERDVTTIGKSSRDGRPRKSDQQLLPGVPDDITITSILSKLPWPMLQTFAVVSRGWLQAIRGGKIFEAKVSGNSTQTIFVHDVRDRKGVRFSLYSVEDNSVYSLPTVPDTSHPLTRMRCYTSVKGRLYVFGFKTKTTKSPKTFWGVTKKIYLIYEYDLVRHRGWKRCANPRFPFGPPRNCAVMNGRIIVFDYISRCALYDPDADFWYPIFINSTDDFRDRSPIISYVDGPYQKVLTGMGIQEDFVYQYGYISDSRVPVEWIKNFRFERTHDYAPFFSFPSDVHTESAEQEVKRGSGIAVTLIDGRFFKLTQQQIDAYDSFTNTWTPLYFCGPFEFDDYRSDTTAASTICAIDVAVVRIKNEIYSVVERCYHTVEGPNVERELFLMKSKILVQGSERQENLSSQENGVLGPWKQLKCKLPLSNQFLRCPIQL